MAGTFDLTFRTDSAGNMVKGRRGEYVCNIVQMLFAMIPGSDPYEPEKGASVEQNTKNSTRKYRRNRPQEGYDLHSLFGG